MQLLARAMKAEEIDEKSPENQESSETVEVTVI